MGQRQNKKELIRVTAPLPLGFFKTFSETQEQITEITI